MDSSDCDKEDTIETGVIGTVSMDLEIRILKHLTQQVG